MRQMILLAAAAAATCLFGAGAPEGLMTEYRGDNPVGLDAARPRLAWALPPGTRAQTAYEIETDGVPRGRTASAEHLNVAWPGAALGSGERHVWRVRTWDARGEASDWSRPASFTTGVMKPADWKAKWIGPNAATRRDEDFGAAQWITGPADRKGATVLTYAFDLPALPARGECVEMVHLGVSQHEIDVNGKSFHKWSGHVHDWRYPRFRDMTPWLKAGRNEITVRVFADDTRRGEPIDHLRVHAAKDVRAFLAKITLPGGRTLVTGRDWKAADGQAAATLGGLRETPYGRALILRTESASPAFAKTFAVKGPVRSAVLHVTGVGFYEASLDGAKIGEKVLDPSPTAFDRHVLYSTYRLDGALKPGAHELKILVGHGWYDIRGIATWNFDTAAWRSFPRAIAQLDITYADGTRETVATDATWRQVKSPVAYDCIREGEVVGESRWQTVDLEKAALRAEEVPGPGGALVSEQQPGAKVVRTFAPKAIRDLGGGAYLAAFPENVAGWIRLRLRGQKKGDVVSIRYDERANADLTPAEPSVRDGLHNKIYDCRKAAKPGQGECRHVDEHFRYPASHRQCAVDAAFQTDRYVCTGAAEETYAPRFTYNGFRYVLLRGLARAPRAEDLVCCVVQTDFPQVGSFDCSDPTLVKLMRLNDRAYRSNFADGVPTDCPHREKNGWTGDAWIASELAQYVYENTAAYEKWVRDLCDTQLPDGNVCCIAPTSGWGFHWGNGPSWDVALAVIPWNLWRYRGDRKILTDVYPYLVKYLAYTATRENADGLVTHGLGDWVPVNRAHMPKTELTSSCFYYQMLRIAEEIAKLERRAGEAAGFAARAAKLAANINRTCYRGDGVYDNGGQTAQAFALAFGIVPPENLAAVRAKLVAAVLAAGGHVDLGLLGTKYVFRELSEAGRTDLALKMLVNPTEPSPAAWIQKGGTSLWEDWSDGSSRNHIMFGDFAAWAYQYLAGIRLDEAAGSTSAVRLGANAFSRILFAPQVVDALEHASASVVTPYGRVASAWRRAGGRIRFTFTVPAGATAEARLPDGRILTLAAGLHEAVCPAAAPAAAKAKIAIADFGFAPGRKNAYGTPSDPKVFARALAPLGETFVVPAENFAQKGVLDRANVDLLVVPAGAAWPYDAVEALVGYLKKGGSLLTTGGYAFDVPVQRTHRGAWVPFVKPLPPRGTTRFATAPAKAWGTSTPGGSKGATVELAGGGITVSTDRFHLWCTGGLGIGKTFAGQSVVSFMVRGRTGAKRATLELDETDGSRWLCHFDVDGAWREKRLTPFDFAFFSDCRAAGRRGGKGDRVNFDRVTRMSIGCGPGEASENAALALDAKDFRVGVDPDPALRQIQVPQINTRTAKIRDAIHPRAEQINAFDPSFTLREVASIGTDASTDPAIPAFALKGAFTGLAAVAQLGVNGHGYSANRCTLQPILEARAADGSDRGPAASFVHHFAELFAGSSWAIFGVDNADLFTEGSEMVRKVLPAVAKKLLARTALNATTTSYACYRAGETAELRTRVGNFGAADFAGTVRFILRDDRGAECARLTQPFTAKKGANTSVTATWPITASTPDYIAFDAEILDGAGRVVDREPGAFVVWNEGVIARGPKLTIRDGLFALDGRTGFWLGAQTYWGQTRPTTARSPRSFARDFAQMRSAGLRFTRLFLPWTCEEDRRISDACVQLAQKHGLVIYHTQQTIPTMVRGAELKAQNDMFREIAARYRAVPGFMIDIRNEPHMTLAPSWASAQQMRTWVETDRAGARLGRPDAIVSVGWSQGWAGGKISKDPAYCSLDMDFTDRHYYGPPARMFRDLKDLDLRALGKPLALPECGAKCHPTFKSSDPWGMGDDDDSYSFRFRSLVAHAYGLGATALLAWHWRDPLEGIFPCGLTHGTGVMRPTAAVFAKMAKTLAQLELAPNAPDVAIRLAEEPRMKNEGRAAFLEKAYAVDAALKHWGANWSKVTESALARCTVKLVLDPEKLPTADAAALREAVGAELGKAGCRVSRRPGDADELEAFFVPGRTADAWMFWTEGEKPRAVARGAARVTVRPGRPYYLQLGRDGAVQVSEEL